MPPRFWPPIDGMDVARLSKGRIAAGVAPASCGVAYRPRHCCTSSRVIGEVDELREDWGVEYSTEPKIDIDAVQRAQGKGNRNAFGRAEATGEAAQGSPHRRPRRRSRTPRRCKLDGDDDSSIPAGGKLTYDHCAFWQPAAFPPCRKCFGCQRDRVMDSTGALALARPARDDCWSSAADTLDWRWELSTPSWVSKVSVVELTDGLLPGADRDLVRPLHKRLETAV